MFKRCDPFGRANGNGGTPVVTSKPAGESAKVLFHRLPTRGWIRQQEEDCLCPDPAFLQRAGFAGPLRPCSRQQNLRFPFSLKVSLKVCRHFAFEIHSFTLHEP